MTARSGEHSLGPEKRTRRARNTHIQYLVKSPVHVTNPRPPPRGHSGTLIWSAACQPGRGLSPAVCGVEFGEGSASAVVDVCVATHMRGLVPHDRMCEMRSGAGVSGVERDPLGLLTVFSRVAPRVVAPVRSPRRAVESGATPSSPAPSSVRRARARRRRRRSSAACLASRARASVRAAAGRCARPGLAPREACRRVCVRA